MGGVWRTGRAEPRRFFDMASTLLATRVEDQPRECGQTRAARAQVGWVTHRSGVKRPRKRGPRAGAGRRYRCADPARQVPPSSPYGLAGGVPSPTGPPYRPQTAGSPSQESREGQPECAGARKRGSHRRRCELRVPPPDDTPRLWASHSRTSRSGSLPRTDERPRSVYPRAFDHRDRGRRSAVAWCQGTQSDRPTSVIGAPEAHPP